MRVDGWRTSTSRPGPGKPSSARLAHRPLAEAAQTPTLDRAEIRRRVVDARVARLATVGPDRRPHLVPVTFALVEDVVYTAVDHKPKRSRRLKRLANIAAHPEVALLVDAYEDDWSRLWWCRLDGQASVLHHGSSAAVQALTEKYPQYREEPPAGPVIAIQIGAWTGWTAT